MSEKIAVHTPTQESYYRLMKAYEKKGWKWCSNRIATDEREDNRNEYKENTCVMFCDSFHFGSKGYYERSYTNLTIITVEEAIARLGQYERGQEVLVKRDGLNWMKRIYLTTIDGAECPYATVGVRDENKYELGKTFGIEVFQHIKPLEEPIKEMTMQEVETALGHKVKIVK